jgi:hypothetical protein
MVQREIAPLSGNLKALEFDNEGNGINPMPPKEGLGASRNASGFFFSNWGMVGSRNSRKTLGTMVVPTASVDWGETIGTDAFRGKGAVTFPDPPHSCYSKLR